jgi:hypothetical protein
MIPVGSESDGGTGLHRRIGVRRRRRDRRQILVWSAFHAGRPYRFFLRAGLVNGYSGQNPTQEYPKVLKKSFFGETMTLRRGLQ